MKSNAVASDGSNPGLALELSLDGVPRGERSWALRSGIRAAVRNGSLRAGTRLPASRTLARDLDVSRGVVVRAYEQLAAEGYLRARQGRGTEVADVAGGAAPATPQPEVFPTNPGLPAGALFPRRAWLRSATRAMTQLSDADLAYGDPMGHPHLRAELSSHLGRVRAVIGPPERILIVNGFAQAARIMSEVLATGGIADIGVEDPGSAGLREQLRMAGMTCHPIPVDDGGLRVDALASTSLRCVVVTPAHQFPTGAVMAPQRRRALLSWARATGGLVIEDDYDAELRYDRSPVGALQGLGPEVVVYGGSVSKTLAPALRLGWLVLPERLVADARTAKYGIDLATATWEQVTLADFLASGEMDRHVRRSARRYRARRDRLVGAVAACLPGWQISGTAAGLHVVVCPPDGADDVALASLARRCGLDAQPLSRYTVAEDRAGLVIGYGTLRPDALRSAVVELARHAGPAAPTSRPRPATPAT